MAKNTGVIPQALLEKPTIQAFDAEIWNAFSRLSSRRPVSGFGAVGAIPYIEMLAYLEFVAKIDDPDEFAVFVDVIDHLDQGFLQDYFEQQKKDQKSSSGKKKPTANK